MKNINDYVFESVLLETAENVEKEINAEAEAEAKAGVDALNSDDPTSKNDELKKASQKYWVNSPYKFFIYNEGAKNTNFKITFAMLDKLRKNIAHYYTDINEYGMVRHTSEKPIPTSIKIDIAPEDFRYKVYQEKRTNLTVRTYSYLSTPGLQYGIVANKQRKKWWLEESADTLRHLKKYFVGGKLPCIATLEDDELVITIDSPLYKRDKEEKVKEMENPDNLQKYEKERNKNKLEWEKWQDSRKAQKEAVKHVGFNNRVEKMKDFKRLKAKGYTLEQIRQMWHNDAVRRCCGYDDPGVTWTGD